MPIILVYMEPAVRGLHHADDGQGAYLYGEAEEEIMIYRLWGGAGNGLLDEPLFQTAWKGEVN